jgi:hypothetical protein
MSTRVDSVSSEFRLAPSLNDVSELSYPALQPSPENNIKITKRVSSDTRYLDKVSLFHARNDRLSQRR